MIQTILSYLLRFDGSSARKELAATKGAQDKLKASADQTAKAEQALAASVDAAGDQARGAAADVQALSEAELQAAQTAKKAAQGHTLAAGSVANLTAQFNDIGIMMMAGQNPLQMAVQQGTQITQVIGPMGAAGAARALGTAFVQMINPVTLITVGSIAAGAAMVQWLTSAGDAARDTATALEDLRGGVSEYRDIVKLTKSDNTDLFAQFGSGAEAARETLERLADVQERIARSGVDTSIATFLGETRVDYDQPELGDQLTVAEGFGYSGLVRALGGNAHEISDILGEVLSDYSDLNAAMGGSIQEQVAALDALYQSYEKGALASGSISEQENERLNLLAGLQRELLQLQAIEEVRAGRDAVALAELEEFNAQLHHQVELAEAVSQHGADSAEVAELRLSREREILEARLAQMNAPEADKAAALANWDAAQEAERVAEAQTRQAEEAERLAALHERDEATLQQMLASMTQQNQIAAAIAEHGEDSAQVAQLRRAIEGENLELMLSQSNASDATKDALRDAWAAGQAFASVDMVSGVAAAREEAQRLADEVLRAVAGVQSLQSQAAMSMEDAQIRLDHAGDPVATARALGVARMKRQQALLREGANIGEEIYLDQQAEAYGDQMARIAQMDKDRLDSLRSHGGGSGRGGSRATATDREREAVERLIRGLREELDVMRETDPVAREMIQHRDALKAATDGEREAVRRLIEERQREGAELEALTARQEFYRDIAYDALEGLLLRGESLTDVLGNVAEALSRALLQAALLGQGPLGSLFGTTPGVGLLNLIFPSPVAMATGGMVYGPGSGTSDSVPAWLSSGEFVVNAAATREHRALLEMINGSGGGVLRMALGGPVPGGARPSAPIAPIARPNMAASNDAQTPRSSGGVVRVIVSASPLLRAEIAQTSQGVAAELLESYDRDVLPGSLERVSSDMRSVG